MKKILLISDTHSYIDEDVLYHVSQCDEVWHAGDIGNLSVIESIEKLKPLVAVFGNIDSQNIRALFAEKQIFYCEQLKIFITHIGGYPGKYTKAARECIIEEKPDIFICGHSHILKIMYDKKLQTLHLNPGAVGVYGVHTVRTMLSFTIDGKQIKDMKIIELPRKKTL